MLEIAACVLTVALASTAVPASGGVEARQEPPTQDEPPVEAADPEDTAQGEAEAEAENDTCRQPAGGSWIDWLQRNVYRSVCLTALWFDDLFGDERIGGEREGTWGRVSAGLAWDEHDDLDGRFRLRVRLALPRMERRLHAVIGRDEPEREVAVGPGGGEWIPEAFRETDRDWLTGLEYKPVRGDRHDIDVGVGVRLSTPVDPYLRVRYRLQQPLASRWLLRQQVAPFWRDSTELGLGTRTDLDHSLHPGLLLRLSTAAQITGRSEGVEWQAGPTLYQRLGEGRAIAYRLIGEGTTDARETSVYRLETLLRQRLHREWLVLELQPRLEWRHPVPEEPRELVPGFGIGVEMRLGDRGDRRGGSQG